MNIIQCSICKKPFQSLGGKICVPCLDRIDTDFITVRDYIYDNKHAGLDKVSEETGVPKQIIMHLLKEGRLMIDDPDSADILHCEMCRKPINTGRLCKACKEKLSSKMQSNIETNKPAEPGKKDSSFKGTAKLQNK